MKFQFELYKVWNRVEGELLGHFIGNEGCTATHT